MLTQLSPFTYGLHWTGDTALSYSLFSILALYAIGYARARHRVVDSRAFGFGRCVAFLGGILTVTVALFSPLDEAGEFLLSAHMVQHILLLFAAPPLFVASSPLRVLALSMPDGLLSKVRKWWSDRTKIRSVVNFLRRPAALWLLFASSIWMWHVPSLYEAALTDESVHLIQHGVLFGAALAFWAGVLRRPLGQNNRIAFGASILYATAMALQTGILGAFITFAARPWYAVYTRTALLWGTSPLFDQQLAGLILWIPGILLYVVTALILFVLWLNAIEREVRVRQDELETTYFPASIPEESTLTQRDGQVANLN